MVEFGLNRADAKWTRRVDNDEFASIALVGWIHLAPPALWKRVAEAMCALGWGRLKHIGAAIWNYDQMCKQFRESSHRPATGLRRKSGSPP